jgi:hypothetical protein
MSPMNLGSTPLLRACAFLLLALTPSFSLAQDPFDEIPKLQKRMDGLEAQIYASQGRFIVSEAPNPRQDNALMLLTHTSKNLNMINREFQALFQYKLLAGLITGKSATQYALGVVVDQRELLKKLDKASIEVLEKTMHSAGDQETNRLLLEARDLFRSSAELLDRLQVPETTAK